MTNALSAQAMRDGAPVGSVGAPGGLMGNVLAAGSGGTGRDPMSGLLGLGSYLPGIGSDVLGPLADLRMMQQNPDTRTLGNALMFGAGLLPAVPSMTYLMSRGGGKVRGGKGAKKQRGVIGQVELKAPGMKKSVRYGENPTTKELESLVSDTYRIAEKAATKRYGLPPHDLSEKQLMNFGSSALRTIKVGDKTYMWPAEAALHEYMASALGLAKQGQERGMMYVD